MDTLNKIQLVQQSYQAFGSGDMETFFGNLTENFVWESRYPTQVPFSGTYTGATGVGELLHKIGSSISIEMFASNSFFANDNKVVVLGEEKAIVKATNKAYHQQWVHVWEITDGKLSRMFNYNDTYAVKNAFSE